MKIVGATLSLACAVAMVTGSAATADLIAYDGFETYTSGTNLNGGAGGTGWAGNWATVGDHTTVQTETMIDPNGNVDGGSQAARVQLTSGQSDIPSFISRALPNVTGTLYMSMLIRREASIGSDDFLNFQVSDGATGNTTAALGVGLRNAGGAPFFARVGSSSSGQTTNASATTAGTDYLIVAKFSKDGSANYNRTDLFINPVDASEPMTADATAISGVTGLSTLSLFSVRNFNPEAGDTLFFDELRFATTFEDAIVAPAIPEPSTLAVVGLGGVLIAGRRRR